MKNKKTNKIIVLVAIGIIVLVSLLIFILNYSKDDSSFSILEKKWLNDNKDKVIDVSIYNDVPIYGMNGKGINFDFLDQFNKNHEIEFNKIPYFIDSEAELKDFAFMVLDYDEEITADDILIYEDNYVILAKNTQKIDRITDMKNLTIGVLARDLDTINYFLEDSINTSFYPYENIDTLLEDYNSGQINYMILPHNLYLDDILETENANIVYHISDMTKKYVLRIKNNENLKTIITKFYNTYKNDFFNEAYSVNFNDLFFEKKDLSEAKRASYNSTSYTYGFLSNMPFEDSIDKKYVGVLSNYLKEFSNLVDVDFKYVKYNSIEELKKAISNNEVDIAFGNFDISGITVGTIPTISPFYEKYVVLSDQENLAINSINSLENKEVMVVKGNLLHDHLKTNPKIKLNVYNNVEELLRNVGTDKILVLDNDTYDYYRNQKLANYKIVYEDYLDSNYRFLIRNEVENETISKLFSYYVSTINYEKIKYDYNMEEDGDFNLFNTTTRNIFIVLIVIIIIIIIMASTLKRHKKDTVIKKEEKLKFIDMMTSLKNRNYLNYNIDKWDENVIYPQTIIVVDLNNIKYINDNYGHEKGDEIIKKAASILIANQLENSDIIRTDGNEFLIYMVGYDEKQVVAYTRKIYKELKELEYGFGAAIGYSMITDDIKLIDDAINEATLDMRTNKENSKN